MQGFWGNSYQGWGGGMMGISGWYGWNWMLLVVIWSLAWKGLALWHAARRSEKGWFIALLVINTAGILEIVYLAAVVGLWGKGKDDQKIA